MFQKAKLYWISEWDNSHHKLILSNIIFLDMIPRGNISSKLQLSTHMCTGLSSLQVSLHWRPYVQQTAACENTGPWAWACSAVQCTDLLESGFNDGVPVFDGGDGVWMADGQDGLPHACGFVQGNTFLFQLLHELLQGKGQKQWRGMVSISPLAVQTLERAKGGFTFISSSANELYFCPGQLLTLRKNIQCAMTSMREVEADWFWFKIWDRALRNVTSQSPAFGRQ